MNTSIETTEQIGIGDQVIVYGKSSVSPFFSGEVMSAYIEYPFMITVAGIKTAEDEIKFYDSSCHYISKL